jgi:ribonuclease G
MSENIIVINADLGETRVALVENGIIVELLLERQDDRSIVGNIYRGKVTRILPGMQAAFLDIGQERNAFLHASDLNYDELDSRPKNRPTRTVPIRSLLKEGESLIVQISKGPISTKGARVTTNISMPGRHLVFMPFSNRGGVSRRIESETERRRLSKVLKHLNTKNGSLIARTVAEGASADALAADADYLTETWANIQEKYKEKKKPGLMYEELDLPLRIARDRLSDSVVEVIVDNRYYYNKLRDFIDRLMPSRLDALKIYEGSEPVFDAFGIESEIKRALDKKVELPSGGTLIIDQAEALTAIDVNTGKFVGKNSRDQEETILATNLEAVDEIVYQLRFRNIGGLIVLDLIDMDRPVSRQKVLSRLKKALQGDRAKASVIRISEFGLVEMTRQRTSDSLGRTLHEPCSHCEGTGHILSRVTVANEALRELRRRSDEFKGDIELKLHPNVGDFFKGKGAQTLKKLESIIHKRVFIKTDSSSHPELFQLRTPPMEKSAAKEK